PVYADTRSAAWVLSRLAFRAHPWNLPAAVQRDGQGAGGGYFAARDVLSRAGIQFVQALEVPDAAAARDAAREIVYPIVLKAMGAEHKSDAGAVRIGIADEAGLNAALDEMSSWLRPLAYSV